MVKLETMSDLANEIKSKADEIAEIIVATQGVICRDKYDNLSDKMRAVAFQDIARLLGYTY